MSTDTTTTNHLAPEHPTLPSRGSSRVLLTLLFFLLIGYPFIKFGFVETWGYVGGDFDVFCIAAERLLEGESPYPPEAMRNEELSAKEAIYGEYIYPALFARMMIPFTYLPRYRAKLVYLFLSLGLYAWLVFPWPEMKRGKRVASGVAIAVLLGWGPVIENIRFGQSNLVPLFFFAVSWKISKKWNVARNAGAAERRIGWAGWVAGGLFGLGASIKLTPLLLAPALAVTRNWRLLGGVAIGAGAGLLLSGPRFTYDYLTKIVPLVADLPSLPNSYSLSTILNFASASLLGIEVGTSTCALLYLGLLIYLERNRKEIESEDLILLGCVLPALFAGLWFHHYVVAVLPLSVALSKTTENCMKKFEDGSVRERQRSGLFAGVLILSLLPGFIYWYPVKIGIDALLGTTQLQHSTLFVSGFALASVLLIPTILKTRRADA